MDQKYFSENIIKCRPTLFCMVLGGTRNFGYENARTVAHVTGTSIHLWMDPQAKPEDRVKAWNDYKEKAK